jgi:parallel beta-helix repeat protein
MPGDAPGTLRQAIFDANALPGPDVITFALDVRGTLSQTRSRRFYIYDSLEIQGPGIDQLTVANASFSVVGELIEFTISDLNLVGSPPSCGPGTDCGEPVMIDSNGASLTIVNVTMSNGPSFGVKFGEGELTMKNSSVVGMQWTGILFGGGRSFIENSTIRDNGDRGIYLGSGTHIIQNSEISGNVSLSAGGGGGAGISFFGDLTIESSLLANNSTPRGRGGAIHGWGALTIRNSTVSGNFAKFIGGGIYLRSGSASVQGTTITNNRTSSVSANAGGGIFCSSTLRCKRSAPMERCASFSRRDSCTTSEGAGATDVASHNVPAPTAGR